MSLLQLWRMKGWEQVSADVYATAYNAFGGSVATHPITIAAISEVLQIPVMYYAKYEGETLIATIPVWKKWLAGSKKALKRLGKKGIVDMGNAEIILPVLSGASIKLPVSCENLSVLHAQSIHNIKNKAAEICLAKPHTSAGLSKKFRYNQRRELRLLEEKGARIKPVNTLDNVELVKIYIELFEKRWGFKPAGHERLNHFIEKMRPLIFGSFIEISGKPIAFQLVYMVQNIEHISMEFINGGVDPAYNEFSPGSVLTFINTQRAWALSDESKKPLRYSFGKADAGYKDRWCNRSSVYSV